VAQSLDVELGKSTKQLKEMDKLLKGMLKSMGDIEKMAGKLGGGGGGGNLMSGSLAKFGGALMGAGIATAGAAFTAMPALSQVVERATGFYNAGVMQGGMAQGTMLNRLTQGLGKFGIQSPMATAQLAQFYGQSGIRIGSQYEGGLTRAVGNAASYLNMDSNRAASALAGLNSGAGSGSLLRQFGIFTSDPRTGRMYNQTQIFKQLSGRLTAGRGKASVSDVQDSFFRGNLGATLRDSGLSEDQQQLFYQYELSKAAGINMDLSSSKSMAAAKKELESRGLINPQNSMNQIAASEESVLQSYQAPYLQGLKDAVPLIEAMNNALKSVPDIVKQLAGTGQAVAGTNAGSAAMDLFGQAGSALLGAAGSFLGGRAGGSGGKAVGSLASRGLKMFKVAGPVGALAGGAVLAADAAGGQGWGTKQFSSDMGSVIGGLAGGALGSLLGPVGTFAGGALGSLAGSAIGGMFGSGGGYEGYGAKGAPGSTSANNKDHPKFVKPASGNITSGYGPRKAPTAGASTFHRGVDIANAMGTPIGSAADGKVIFAGPNGSFGNHVKVQHGGGYVTTYSHLSRIDAKRGTSVVAGQRIGSMGTTGVSTGTHLHFEVLRNGANIDPATVVAGLSIGSGVTATVTGGGGGKGKKTAAQAKAATTAEMLASMSENRGGLLGISNGVLNGVSQGIDNILSGVNQNEDILSGNVTGGVSTGNRGTSAKYTGQGGGNSSSSMSTAEVSLGGSTGGRNNVVINVNIARASDDEARRFAKMVKNILEEESSMAKIGKM
jgi:hypothetical protein